MHYLTNPLREFSLLCHFENEKTDEINLSKFDFRCVLCQRSSELPLTAFPEQAKSQMTFQSGPLGFYLPGSCSYQIL